MGRAFFLPAKEIESRSHHWMNDHPVASRACSPRVNHGALYSEEEHI